MYFASYRCASMLVAEGAYESPSYLGSDGKD